jgi:carnitine 3-dehydrogenase
MRMCGVDTAYVEAGGSYFTVETHIRHLDEVKAGAEIYATTQVVAGAGKKMHLFHSLFAGDDRLLATGEHMLLHVDMNSRSSSLPGATVAARLEEFVTAHKDLPMPDGAGRAIGKK